MFWLPTDAPNVTPLVAVWLEGARYFTSAAWPLDTDRSTPAHRFGYAGGYTFSATRWRFRQTVEEQPL